MKKSEKLLLGVGFLVICMMLIPALVLGEGAILTYHDQLDGEMIAYILQAKHLGEQGVLPEFMNGASKTALTPPAPLSVLLFLTGYYRESLLVMQLLGSLVGYVGMFLLAREITGCSPVAVIAGGLYGALPFLPVYGFSQYGLPLLLWCVLKVRKEEKRIFAYIYALIFALNSSLALVGFAVLAVFALWMLAEVLRDRRKELKAQAVMWMLMFIGYVAMNLSLIGQMLGVGERVVSHKSEYALAAEGFWTGLLNGFLYGGQHSQDYHLSFLIAGVVVWVVSKVVSRGDKAASIRKCAFYCVLCNLFFAAVSALWNCEIGIALRAHMGALGAFGVERFLWLSPCLWFLFLACCLGLLLQLWKERRVLFAVGAVLMMAALSFSGLQIIKNSDVKSNLQKLINPHYPAMSYEDYYAIGVYEQVEEFMDRYTGLPKYSYRVVSLGIDPAAALYHGFYCLDGYSNNYSLEYKHAFRQVIAPALQESDYLRDYYDDWGNRCYLFGSECPGYYTIEKGGFYFQHLELNGEALKELGGQYLFSAAYIANAEELGLTLLTQEPFETKESYYRIYVYEVG